jgi:hypothetical protein
MFAVGSRGLCLADTAIRTGPVASKSFFPAPAGSTEFETKLSQLRLTNETCASSAKLREWCFQNKNRCYIPEWLLKKWGILVNADMDVAS